MKKIILILLFVIILLLGLVFIAQEAQAGLLDFFYKTKEKLTISGNQLFFAGGPITLRGVAVGDPYSRQTTYRRTTSDYITISKDWRANVVRLSIHPSYQKEEKRVKKILADEVAAARENNLFVIIDYHVIGFPNGWYKSWPEGEAQGYSYDSSFKVAMDFWKSIAVEYRDDQGVIFELWNEPADQKTRAWEDIKPYWERLYGLIRSQGAANIIIAPGVYWTYDLRGIKDDPLPGENIGYAWHNYPFSGQYLKWSQALDNLNKYYPVFVTEWGFSADPAKRHYAKLEDYGTPFKKYLIDEGLNFTAWCWHNPWDPRMFESNWVDLTPYGKFVKDFLLGVEASEEFSEEINNFIKNGADDNSRRLGEGERRAVVYSFKMAFSRNPETSQDFSDIIKIVNGRWPSQKSQVAENQAKNNFKKIYRREADMGNKNDEAAITVMAYGLRQRAENRNLDSEKQGIKIFKNIFGRLPQTTEDWNIMQAITYSGAKR
ncbi:MAG: glycoside hydrolase family 5 protein [Patescibacteria group bacterium]|nr:glycoside hydrolase family 5 protein [Patescibacteria group bacterium]MDD5295130.1 glycoside hydrolase family 5 protein [Patescibacteria group bacterium]MDD5554943.1 glycoside hydrolase family 5 protein [Patescibacteria group bacterium]